MHRPRRAVAVLFALAGLLPAQTPAPAKPTAPQFLTGDARTAFLKEIETRMTRVRTIAASFVQDKVMALFDDTVTSHGLILFAQPAELRWETVRPFRSMLIVSGDHVAKFDYTTGTRKPLELGRGGDVLLVVMDQIRGWFRGRFDSGDRYTIDVAREPTPLLVLRPRETAVQGMLRAIEVELAPDLSAVRRVTVRETGDDYTTMTFTELRRDAAVPTTWFDVKDPSEITQPTITELPALPEPKPPAESPRAESPRAGASK